MLHPVPVRLRYQVLAFTITRTIINTAFRMIYPFLPAIARGLGVSLESVTLGITLRSAMGLLSPAFGSFADVWGRKRALLLGVLLFTVGMILVALSPTYPALIISLLLVGASKIVFDPAMYAYLGDHVAYHQRGLAIGLAEFGWSGAFLLGIPVVGWLIARNEWTAPFPWAQTSHLGIPLIRGLLPGERWDAPFIWLMLLGVGLIVLLWSILPVDTSHTMARTSLRQGFRTILTYPPAVAGLTISILISASNETVNIVYGVWMENSFGLQVAALGAASAIIGIAELGGEGLVAGFVDRIGKRRAVGIGLSSYAVACILLPIIGTTPQGALVGLFVFYLTFEFTIVSSIPLMTELIPAARATLMAGNVAAFSLGRVFGSLIGPVLFSYGLGVNAVTAAIMNLIALAALIFVLHEKSIKISPAV
ncbi:MAG TPA: MFS transporter [Terriglobales bacterium]|nr:MFS transporter [Terriglobales bacterium]